MMKATSIVLAATLMFSPVHALAQESPTVYPIKQGQKAPITGLLLNPEAAAKIIVDIENLKTQVNIEVDRAREIQKAEDERVIGNLKADIENLKSTFDAQLKSRDSQLQIVQKRLEEAEKNKPNTLLWTSLGFVGGVAVTVLTVFAIGAATK